MKKILIIICIFCLFGCSVKQEETIESLPSQDVKIDETVKPEETSTSTYSQEDSIETKQFDYSKEIIGEWYPLIGGTTGTLEFKEDGTFALNNIAYFTNFTTDEYGNIADFEGDSKYGSISGEYSVSGDKISIKVLKNVPGHTYPLDWYSKINDKDNANIVLSNNVICFDGVTPNLFVRMGEKPNFDNEYIAKINGYYKDDEYYYWFHNGGMLICYGDFMIANAVWTANDKYIYGHVTHTSGEFISLAYEVDEDGNPTNFINLKDKEESTIRGEFIPITKEEFEAVADKIDKTQSYKEVNWWPSILLVTADALKLRNGPSTSAEQVGVVFRGNYSTFNSNVETIEADGYTWYEYYEGYWAADKNGEWVQMIR